MEGTDDENSTDEQEGLLPAMSVGDKLILQEAKATERFTYPPSRFTEAALVKTRRAWYWPSFNICTNDQYRSETWLCFERGKNG